jgi:catechol 2,3-dioxygenase-like lactoylglutathione lyase family enzyme
MFYQAIDSVYLAVSDLEAARQAHERLGLQLTDHSLHPDLRSWHVGEADNAFAVHLVPATQTGLCALALRVTDPRTTLEYLRSQEILPEGDPPFPAPALALWLPLSDRAGARILLVPHSPAPETPAHRLPVKRIDHLAIVAHDLEAKTQFWTDILGVPVTGEVTTPTMVIRQLRIGDAILELLGPASADSPIHQRPPGLVSVASLEVADLQAAVTLVRKAGFTISDPAPGPLPSTHIATVSGDQLGGLNLQLLQYLP